MPPDTTESDDEEQQQVEQDLLIFGKDIGLEAIASDGGAYSHQYRLQNVLAKDSSVYCTSRNANVNLLFKIVTPVEPVFISSVSVRAPPAGFSSPITGMCIGYSLYHTFFCLYNLCCTSN